MARIQEFAVETFTLDTSGVVLPFERYDPRWNTDPVGYRWTDFDPFTQGYVEALFASSLDALTQNGWITSLPKFSDLAPESLAAILKDCERFCRNMPGRVIKAPQNSEAQGASFWRLRQQGVYLKAGIYPPLTPYLGDDGKVYLRERV